LRFYVAHFRSVTFGFFYTLLPLLFQPRVRDGTHYSGPQNKAKCLPHLFSRWVVTQYSIPVINLWLWCKKSLPSLAVASWFI